MSRAAFTWSVIGASGIAESSIIPALQAQPETSIASVVSADAARAQQLAAPLGARAITDLDEALSDPAVDAVYISSVNSEHYGQTMAAIAAGKNVMCEKPIALQVGQGIEMAQAARRAGVLLATNHHMRNSTPHRMMRDAIAAGDLGDVVAASVRHAVELPEVAQGWRTRSRTAGAGVVLDITVHDADALRYVLGSDPVSVQAYARSGAMTSDGIDESVVGVAHFGSGVDVEFFESFVTGHAPTELAVYGTKASMIGTGIQSMQPVGSLAKWVGGVATEIDLGDREDLYTIGFRRFQATVTGAAAGPAATAEDGIWSLAFADAALRSITSGAVEAVTSLTAPTPAGPTA